MSTLQLTNNQKTRVTNQNIEDNTPSDVITTDKYKVYSSNKSSLKKITSYDQINSPHHGGGSYQTTKIDGKTQRTRADGGTVRVVQDLVLQQEENFNVGVPSGVSGYAVVKRDIKSNGKGYGNYVEIQDTPGGKGKVIARYAHLASTKVQTGDIIKRGTILGVQGNSGATHLHVEMESKEFKRYISDLQSGKFSNKEISSQKTSSDSMAKINDITASKDEVDSYHQHDDSLPENRVVSKTSSSQKVSLDNDASPEATSTQEIGDSTIEATSSEESQEIDSYSTNGTTSTQEISSNEMNESISSQEVKSELTSEETSTQEKNSSKTITKSNDTDKVQNKTDETDSERTTNLPKIYEGNNIEQNNITNVSKVVELLRKNGDEVKKQYGFDVNTNEGLGKAVMQFWKENKLDPKTLKDQLPQISISEFESALNQISSIVSNNVNTNTTTKEKQLVS
jgi:hypothetical protein